MPTLILDAAGLALLFFVAVYLVVLTRRMARLRAALAEAGTTLPSLDAAVERMNETASGLSLRLQNEIAAVDERITTLRGAAGDLDAARTTAETLMSQLDRQLRQARRLDTARSTAIPRELAEPKGYAERFARQAVSPSALTATRALPAPADGLRVGRPVRVTML